jgi:hypothetical protein
VAVTAEDLVVFLGAHLVRFIDSVVGGFDALKVCPDHCGACDPVVFVRGGQPVAVLMSLRYKLDDLPIDIPTVRNLASRSWTT